MERQTLGQYGEALARQHLQQRGYHILAQNWRCRLGELDIVAQDGETIVFVEVKTRRAQHVEAAFAALSITKRERLLTAIYAYLAEQADDDALWRLDAIGIALPKNGQPLLDHVEDAFDW